MIHLSSGDETNQSFARGNRGVTRRGVVLGVFVASFIGRPMTASADLDDCRDAIDSYNSSLSDISAALRSYADCVADSHGHDDCSVEFSTLQEAQSSFEEAVSSYEGDCQ